VAADAPANGGDARVTLHQPTRILVVGGGGREHALAWKLAEEPGVNEVVVAPGSDGIAQVPRVRTKAIDPLDAAAVVALARAEATELVVVGPEAPLAAGVADALAEAGIAVFGPSGAAARIESSKAFCHDVAEAAGVRMARATIVTTPAEAAAAIHRLAQAGNGFVVKEDGLAAGKGVVVVGPGHSPDLARALVERVADGPLVIEERLQGPEASVIAICDGARAIALPAARDHKRLRDGDEGPNTGGMGAYSPLPDLSDADVDRILEAVHRPILAELARRGTPFRGFLYAGLMLTADGPALLECNARLGDPETQVILPRLAGALAPWLRAAARGSLPADAPTRLPVLPGAAVGIVLASEGYPEEPRKGDAIDGLDDAPDALVFHAGIRRDPVGGGWLTNGGRVLTVVGRGGDLDEARARAERAADRIAFRGVQRRRDIAASGGATGPAAVAAGTFVGAGA
jgi:phosphoribosylamine--glycine ligase